jgi:hypothetical protein
MRFAPTKSDAMRGEGCEYDKLALAREPLGHADNSGSRAFHDYFALTHGVAGSVHRRGATLQYDFTTGLRSAVHSR